MNFLDELEGLITNKFGAIKTLISMTKLEGRLAGLSILPFVLCTIFLMTIALSTWLTLNALMGYLAWLYFGKVIWSFAAVLLFNLIVLSILKKYLLVTLRKMSFEKTRKYFEMVLTTSENTDYESREANSTRAAEPRAEIADSTKQSQ